MQQNCSVRIRAAPESPIYPKSPIYPCREYSVPRSRLVTRPSSRAISPWATQTCNGGWHQRGSNPGPPVLLHKSKCTSGMCISPGPAPNATGRRVPPTGRARRAVVVPVLTAGRACALATGDRDTRPRRRTQQRIARARSRSAAGLAPRAGPSAEERRGGAQGAGEGGGGGGGAKGPASGGMPLVARRLHRDRLGRTVTGPRNRVGLGRPCRAFLGRGGDRRKQLGAPTPGPSRLPTTRRAGHC